ncbi:MAG: hypothetical protein WC716_15145 [Chitinophagaceae bacterium]|jgi:hypothetical protein
MPTERPLIAKDYLQAPELPCTGTSAAFYEPLFIFHSISEEHYLAMIADIPQAENNLLYREVMNRTIDLSGADCKSDMVQITIDDESELLIALVPKFPIADSKSCLPLSLFKGFKLLLESMNGFDENLCWFHFKRGICTYLNPANREQPVVVFTITYDGAIIGYYDVSTPPPVIN